MATFGELFDRKKTQGWDAYSHEWRKEFGVDSVLLFNPDRMVYVLRARSSEGLTYQELSLSDLTWRGVTTGVWWSVLPSVLAHHGGIA